ncbi:hypothetical protein Tco_0015852 [Tanacetum coccineum]
MSASTISSESLPKSTGSSPVPNVLYPASVDDLKSKPFEDPASPVVSDSDSFMVSRNFDPFEDRVSLVVYVAADSDSPSASSAPISPYRHHRTVQGSRKMVRPQPTLPPSTLALIAVRVAAPPSPSPPPSPLSPLSSSSPPLSPSRSALLAPALPTVPVDLIPPRKRFGAMERIETLKREVESLAARLVAAEIQITALQREETSRDIREVGISARL